MSKREDTSILDGDIRAEEYEKAVVRYRELRQQAGLPPVNVWYDEPIERDDWEAAG